MKYLNKLTKGQFIDLIDALDYRYESQEIRNDSIVLSWFDPGDDWGFGMEGGTIHIYDFKVEIYEDSFSGFDQEKTAILRKYMTEIFGKEYKNDLLDYYNSQKSDLVVKAQQRKASIERDLKENLKMGKAQVDDELAEYLKKIDSEIF